MGGSPYRRIRPPGGSSGSLKKRRAVFPPGRSCPYNRTASISFAIFIFNRHLCREMPDNIRLRSDGIARPKKIRKPYTRTIVGKVVDPVNVIPALGIHPVNVIRISGNNLTHVRYPGSCCNKTLDKSNFFHYFSVCPINTTSGKSLKC
jgi:hypothetical protein